ncbi:hypothetical protein, partial [Pseudophaeobacter profundi]|uniref:hypothetical protein n=1 Tax=Pseudophaeobacter profundi TaxID=3034152 RepID=UPI00242E4A41
MRIYNSLNCSLHVNVTDGGKSYSWAIESLGLLEQKSLPVNGQANLIYSAEFDNMECSSMLPVSVGILAIFEAKAV